MRVALFPSWYPTSPDDVNGVFFREQAFSLARKGVEVAVFAPPKAFRKNPRFWMPFFRIKQFEDDNGVKTYRPRFFSWSSLLNRGASSTRACALRVFDEYCRIHGKPDIIHAHSAVPGGEIATFVAEQSELPCVLTEHLSALVGGTVEPERLERSKRVFKSVDVLIAVGETLLRSIESLCDADLPNGRVIPNVLSRLFEANQPEIRERPQVFSFSSIAVLTARKRLDLLLDAFARAFGDDEKVCLRIGGDGPERGRLEERAKSLNIGDRVAFLGMVNRRQVLEEMSHCQAFVLSSDHETFGMAVIEALSQGLPVVVTRCGGPEDFVHQGNGIVVEPGAVESLAQALVKVRRNFDAYDHPEIRRDCLRRFGEDNVVEQILATYREVITGRESRVS